MLVLRSFLLVPLGLLLAAIVAGAVFGSWIAAQARAVVVLSTTLETPVVTWAVEKLTDEPRTRETTVAGAPATLARPGGGEGPWPALVFVNGATPLGRREPAVQRLALGLARAGYLVLVPDLPGLVEGELSDRTVQATAAVARAVAGRRDARDGRVGLVGVSVGATLALLAAERPRLAERVSVVVGIAPYTNLKEVVRLATTGYHRDGNVLVRYEAASFLGLVVGRSLAAGLPPGPERSALASELEGIDDREADPLAVFRSFPTESLGAEARAVVELLANRDPRRFDRLYEELPAELRFRIARLSPITRAKRLRAPIELASAPRDKYFPVAQSRALARAVPNARLTITEAFGHVVPRPSLTDPGDLFSFDGWAVRSLRLARR